MHHYQPVWSSVWIPISSIIWSQCLYWDQRPVKPSFFHTTNWKHLYNWPIESTTTSILAFLEHDCIHAYGMDNHSDGPGSPLCSYATHFCFYNIAFWASLHHCDCHVMQPTVWPMLASTSTQHYYRHSIVPVIGFKYNTQAPHFPAPFMPHMTLLGFMCPGLGKFLLL